METFLILFGVALWWLIGYSFLLGLAQNDCEQLKVLPMPGEYRFALLVGLSGGVVAAVVAFACASHKPNFRPHLRLDYKAIHRKRQGY